MSTNPRGPNAIDRHVGSRVRLRRQLLNMSQEKLGEELGVTFQQVQKYERGANRVGASRLFELARALDTDVGFFFIGLDEAGAAPADESVYDFINSSDGLALVAAFRRIEDRRVRRSAIELLRVIADGLSPEMTDAEAKAIFRDQKRVEQVAA